MTRFEVDLRTKVLVEAHDAEGAEKMIRFLFEKGNGIDIEKFKIEIREVR